MEQNETSTSVRSLLGQRLPKTRPELEDTLRTLEMWYIRTIDARVEAQSVLHTKRLQYLHPKDPQYTDMDRRIMLEANTADEQAAYEHALGLEKALTIRIEVIRTLLV